MDSTCHFALALPYTIPDSFCAVIKSIADKSSVYNIPVAFVPLYFTKTIADRLSA